MCKGSSNRVNGLCKWLDDRIYVKMSARHIVEMLRCCSVHSVKLYSDPGSTNNVSVLFATQGAWQPLQECVTVDPQKMDV